jgi:uncharacterized surface protein with fasciclin (FAS1) repeats
MKQFVLVATLCLAFAGGAFAQTKKPSNTASTTNSKTVVEIAATSPDHTTLVNAVQVAGLTETLKGKGPFTIFAPTNKAFERMINDQQKQMKNSTPMKQDTMGNNSTWNRQNNSTSSNPATNDTSGYRRNTTTQPNDMNNVTRDTATYRSGNTQPNSTRSNTTTQPNDMNNVTRDTSTYRTGTATQPNNPRTTMQDTTTYRSNTTTPRPTDMSRNNPTTRDTSSYRSNSTMQDTSTYRSNSTTQTDTWSQTNRNTMSGDTIPNPEVTRPTTPTPSQRNEDTTGRNSNWLEGGDTKALTDILNYHVVRGTYDAAALKQAIKAGNGKATLTTVNGAKLTATLQGNTIQIEDVAGNKAKVTSADLRGSNGVIHVIDRVVMPTNDGATEKK